MLKSFQCLVYSWKEVKRSTFDGFCQGVDGSLSFLVRVYDNGLVLTHIDCLLDRNFGVEKVVLVNTSWPFNILSMPVLKLDAKILRLICSESVKSYRREP